MLGNAAEPNRFRRCLVQRNVAGSVGGGISAPSRRGASFLWRDGPGAVEVNILWQQPQPHPKEPDEAGTAIPPVTPPQAAREGPRFLRIATTWRTSAAVAAPKSHRTVPTWHRSDAAGARKSPATAPTWPR